MSSTRRLLAYHTGTRAKAARELAALTDRVGIRGFFNILNYLRCRQLYLHRTPANDISLSLSNFRTIAVTSFGLI